MSNRLFLWELSFHNDEHEDFLRTFDQPTERKQHKITIRDAQTHASYRTNVIYEFRQKQKKINVKRSGNRNRRRK